MTTEAFALEMEATYKRIVAHIEEIETFLADQNNGHDQFVVCQRVLRADGTYGTMSPMQKVGGGYNFAAQTPSQMVKTGFQIAQRNRTMFERGALAEGKRDLDYLVRGVRYVAKQQLEALKGAAEMFTKYQAL